MVCPNPTPTVNLTGLESDSIETSFDDTLSTSQDAAKAMPQSTLDYLEGIEPHKRLQIENYLKGTALMLNFHITHQ